MTPSNSLKVDRRLGATHRVHLQGWIVSEVRNQNGAGLTLSGLHSVIAQKIEHFITIAVRTSNPTFI
jgi:hypothetical protein